MINKEFLNIIKNFKNPKILIVGDLILDEYFWGQVNRISAEAPVPILEVKETSYALGAAANAAHNARALGNEVSLIGVLGLDERGKVFKKILEQKEINGNGIIIDSGRKTTLKTRVLAKNQQIVRIDSEDRNFISSQIKDKIFNLIKEKIKNLDAIMISDYAKGVVSPDLSKNIIELANQNNIPCFVDPKGSDYLKYKNCHIITPNEKELAQALNLRIENKTQFLDAGKMLLSHVMADNILVTQGKKGMTLFKKKGDSFHVPALNKEAVDISGAGDSAITSFILSLAAGANLKQAMIIASHVCGIVVGKMGTAVVSQQELEKSLIC